MGRGAGGEGRWEGGLTLDRGSKIAEGRDAAPTRPDGPETARHARDAPATRPRHARDTPATRPRHARDTPATRPRHARDTPATRPRRARVTPATRPRHARDTPATGPRRARDAPATRPRHARDPTQPRRAADFFRFFSFFFFFQFSRIDWVGCGCRRAGELGGVGWVLSRLIGDLSYIIYIQILYRVERNSTANRKPFFTEILPVESRLTDHGLPVVLGPPGPGFWAWL